MRTWTYPPRKTVCDQLPVRCIPIRMHTGYAVTGMLPGVNNDIYPLEHAPMAPLASRAITLRRMSRMN